MNLVLNDQSSAVLVVEDETLIRMCAADALLSAGFKVFEAVNSTEALEVLNARDDIRVVVTDVEMPGGINGLALTATIHDRWPEVGVIVTSGRITVDRDELPAKDDFIGKPYELDEMVLRVERMLG